MHHNEEGNSAVCHAAAAQVPQLAQHTVILLDPRQAQAKRAVGQAGAVAGAVGADCAREHGADAVQRERLALGVRAPRAARAHQAAGGALTQSTILCGVACTCLQSSNASMTSNLLLVR